MHWGRMKFFGGKTKNPDVEPGLRVPSPSRTVADRLLSPYVRAASACAVVVASVVFLAVHLQQYPSGSEVLSGGGSTSPAVAVDFSDSELGLVAPFRVFPARRLALGVGEGSGSTVVYNVSDFVAPQQVSVASMVCIAVPDRAQELLAGLFDSVVAGEGRSRGGRATVVARVFTQVQGSIGVRGTYSVRTGGGVFDGELLIVAHGVSLVTVHAGWAVSSGEGIGKQQRDFVDRTYFVREAPVGPSCGPGGGSFPEPVLLG